MDKKTIEVYNKDAATYAADWLSQPTPKELHEVTLKYFSPGAATADIGCGSGRDTEWLSKQGFEVIGFDASDGLLNKAKKKFPLLKFSKANLPYLAEIKDSSFKNILCETVLQHLPVETHLDSLKNLLRILKPDGHLVISVRHPTQSSGDRENDERLYVEFNLELLLKSLAVSDVELVETSTFVSSSSGKKISQWFLRKSGLVI